MGVKGTRSWKVNRGKNEKKPGLQTPPLCEETLLKVPGFPGPRNLFHSSHKEGAGLASETFRGITLCFGTGAGCAFSGYQRLASHLHDRGSVVAFGSGPKQVALRFSPEGDPALVWVRPAGRLPVTFFTGAQTERPSAYIINHPA